MTRGFRLTVLVMLLLSTALLAACEKQVVYVNNQSTVSAFELTDSGELVSLPGSPFDKGAYDYTASSDIEIDPTGSYLFATNNGSQAISSFAIGSDGALSLIGTAATDPSPASLAMHPSGDFLYVACVNGDVVIFDVNPDGSLTPSSTYPFFAPERLAMHPSGQWLFVSAYTTGVWVMEIAGDGSLSPTPGSPYSVGGSGSDITGIRIDDTRNLLYANNSYGANLGVLSIDTAGGLTHIPGSPFPDHYGASILQLSTDRQFLYTVQPGLLSPPTWGMIEVYKLDTDGTPNAIQGSPFAAQDDYTGLMATDAKMRYLVATHTMPEKISVYEIGNAGALTPAPLSPYDAEDDYPRAVEIFTVSR